MIVQSQISSMSKRTFQTIDNEPISAHTNIYGADIHEYHLVKDSLGEEKCRLLHATRHEGMHNSHLIDVTFIF